MELQHESGHYLRIKYDWITVPVGDPITFAEVDTGFLKEWNLVQIEGKEPVAQEEAEASKAKDKAAKKPPPNQKGGGGSKLEAIDDTRARIINYERDVASENNGLGLEITEDVAIKFSEAVLNLQVFETNVETSEESLVETVQIDLSCLLYQRDCVDASWRFDKMKAMQLNYLKLHITSEQPLLSDFYRKKLNPLQVNLVSLKDIPFKTEPKYKPIYASLEFIDGKSF